MTIDTGLIDDDHTFGEITRKLPKDALTRIKDRRILVELQRQNALPLYVWGLVWIAFGCAVLWSWITYREALYDLASKGFLYAIYVIYNYFYM